MFYENRQLPSPPPPPKIPKELHEYFPLPLAPLPLPAELPYLISIHLASRSGGCGHDLLDFSSDLLKYKGRLGPPWDSLTDQHLNTQEWQRRQVARNNAYQVNGSMQLQSHAPDVQRPDPASHVHATDNVLASPSTVGSLPPTASPQDGNFGENSGCAARQAYSECGGMSPRRVERRYNSEPIRTNDKGIPLYAPSPRRSSLPKVLHNEPAEDLSSYPPTIHQALERSAYMSSPSGTAEYELVQEDWSKSELEPESDQLVGSFRSRHTANMEAAKMFLHRFWVQVMDHNQYYAVYIGPAGILTLNIETEDAQGGRRWSSVFVRRKGSPGRTQFVVDESMPP